MYILRVFIIIVISALVKMGHKLNCDMRRVTSQGLLPYVYKVLVAVSLLALTTCHGRLRHHRWETDRATHTTHTTHTTPAPAHTYTSTQVHGCHL